MPFSHIISKLANLKEFSDDNSPIFQVSFELALTDTSKLVASLIGETFFYWSDRDTRDQCLAIGASDLIKLAKRKSWLVTFDELQSKCSKNPTLRYYGGLSFSDNYGRDQIWKNLPEMMFFLPLVEIRETPHSTILSINLNSNNLDQELDGAVSILKKLSNHATSTPATLIPVNKTESLNQNQWSKIFSAAQTQFSDQQLSKVVLARNLEYEFAAFPGLDLIANYIQPSPGEVFSFALSFGDNAYFFGRTPEKLFRINSESLETEALAGTVMAENSQTLISDSKLLNEHDFVCQEIEGILSELCEAGTEKSGLKIFHSKGLAHLIKTYNARLHTNKSAEDVLKLLHPTSAVCGIPREQALNFIHSYEPFERGWYAGPIGWIEQKNAIFSVAIRSCLLRDRYLKIFAGAGIVAESTAESEWNEIGLKLNVLKPKEIE